MALERLSRVRLRVAVLAGAICLVVTLPCSARAQYGGHVDQSFEISHGAYRIKIRGPHRGERGDGELWIFRDDQLTYYDAKSEFDVDPDVPIGTDLTGDGIPKIVIQQFTGGAHCCSIALVFALGRQLSLIDRINGRDGPVQFVREDDTGRWLVFLSDWMFRYWRGPFATTPQCDLVLSWDVGKFRLITEGMRHPPYMRAALKHRAAELRASVYWNRDAKFEVERYNADLWIEMADLAYTGNLAQARALLRLVWPWDSHERAIVEREFVSILKKSRFWTDLDALAREPVPRDQPPRGSKGAPDPICHMG
ncbi:MAG: hypothetical protein HY060_07495 [Proteobacteria bacterium]|nr:hypothetical protein [Pseudomonadota bacterium]